MHRDARLRAQNRRNTSQRLELMKYNPYMRAHASPRVEEVESEVVCYIIQTFYSAAPPTRRRARDSRLFDSRRNVWLNRELTSLTQIATSREPRSIV